MMQKMIAGAHLYILLCADGSYYVGTTRKNLEERLGEHRAVVRVRRARRAVGATGAALARPARPRQRAALL